MMMYKKLIVIGIAALVAAPLMVEADVEVYGQARMSVDYNADHDTDVAKTGTTPAHVAGKSDNISVSSNASRLGFKGDEDLGNGVSALWQLEEGVAFDTNSAF